MKQDKGQRQPAAGAGPDDKYKVEAVARASLLLEALRTQTNPSSTSELARVTGIGRSVTAATLATLEKHGLVRSSVLESPEGSEPVADARVYRLGLVWLRLADVKQQQLDIREIAKPVMRKVRDAVNETVSFAIRIGARRVNLDYAEGHHEVRRITQPGYHVPLHVGAAGRILLTSLDDSGIDDYFAAGNAERSPPRLTKSKLKAEIETVRKQGYAVVSGEITSDTAAVSAPIRNHIGDVVAALTISCPEDRFGPQVQSRFIKHVVAAAEEISTALGYDASRGGRRPALNASARAPTPPRSAASAARRAPRRKA